MQAQPPSKRKAKQQRKKQANQQQQQQQQQQQAPTTSASEASGSHQASQQHQQQQQGPGNGKAKRVKAGKSGAVPHTPTARQHHPHDHHPPPCAHSPPHHSALSGSFSVLRESSGKRLHVRSLLATIIICLAVLLARLHLPEVLL